MRSRFESYCNKVLKDTCDYEPFNIEYEAKHTYTPDFVPKNDNTVLIECKGRFRDSKEAAKYVHISNCHPDKELVFIFMEPDTPMPGAKKRKDGTRYSHREWAEKNGFRWYTMRTIPEEWRNERTKS